MNDERDHTGSPKRHRLAWSSALAVVVTALCAPLAGATGIEVAQVSLPVEGPSAPTAPALDPVIPELPEIDGTPVIPDVTTLPAPTEELDGAVDPVVDVVDDATGGVVDGAEDTLDDTGGPVGDAVDEITDPDGPVGGVVDDVTDPDGPVGGVVDDVTDPDGPVGGVVDDVEDVTDPVTDPVVDEVDDATDPVVDDVDEVTGPVKDAVSGVTDGLGGAKDEVVNDVGGLVDGVVGSLPPPPGVPGIDTPGPAGPGPGSGAETGDGDLAPPASEPAAVRAGRIAAAAPPDGFAANVLAAAQQPAQAVGLPSRDVGPPSLVERIARSAADLARKIAFPLLLALAVGAFVLLQNRMDRRDPKLALAAIDVDEELLGFE